MEVGVDTEIDVAVGVDTMGDGCGVAVEPRGVTEEVIVDTGVSVEVGTAVLGAAVTVGYDAPLRTILGATQSAWSLVGNPLASTFRMNLTIFPANGLRSTSA